MPRIQAKQRALNSLTNSINDLLFYQEFKDTIIDTRKRLRIDVNELQERQAAKILREKQIAETLPKRRYVDEREGKSALSSTDFYGRIWALTEHLLERHLISKYSAYELGNIGCIPDSSRFWKIILDVSDELYWSFDMETPHMWIIGGLCFDVTKYSEEYSRTEFNRITRILITEMAKLIPVRDTDAHKVARMSTLELDRAIDASHKIENTIVSIVIRNNLEEYYYFHNYITFARLASNAFNFNHFTPPPPPNSPIILIRGGKR